MLEGIHLLLTYKCNLECEHCFVFSGPNEEGTFTVSQIEALLSEAKKINSLEWIYFEGGEPFLFYPLMLKGIELANKLGFKVGVVTNCYWATSEDDAQLWLNPLKKLVMDLSLSEDHYHYGIDKADIPTKHALKAAQKLHIPVSIINIIQPPTDIVPKTTRVKGTPIIGGDVVFRGRAVDKLTHGLPMRKSEDLCECPYENLDKPSRVHIDAYGNVQVCQGLSIGNVWITPLSRLVKEYDCTSHPICSLLNIDGPLALAKQYEVSHEDKYVDACHFCFMMRKALLDQFPNYLSPRQVYGL
jgi:hypothetical protein